MSHIPSELRYTSTHEWVRLEENNEAVVGITYHAQAMLGDMVFVELPELGSALLEGDDVAVAESVKAATDVYTPVSGIVIGVNDELEASPEQINQDPYGAGWLFRVRLEEAEELDGLMDAESYQQMLENELD
ncbi:glycine cleavage system protein GcvH [Pseudaeromonas pectinilytica]|jgi:glycine cleavage system H protein|nr:glycine cleavage system protein GcvH [Aeromonadaceae bacterium]MBP8772475.1 glycine cleavage system protein GcvH [Aeromonadaceae bacterium]